MNGSRRIKTPVGAVLLALLTICVGVAAQDKKPTVPVFADGEAQVVEGFKDSSKWIRHDLWVQTNFNTDGDDKPDRMHVSVTRPQQTDTEGLKVPVVYVSSPYFAGTGSNGREFFWDPKHELGAKPPAHKHPPAIKHQSRRPVISKSHSKTWVPRGYAVVHSESPGTGLSQGCPTVGGDNESLAPKAVIDWLNGRAPGYTTIDGDEEVKASWCTGKVGMTGTSYNGTLALAAATTGVEGLEAIIPIAPNTSYYHYYRSNGLIRHPGGYMGEDIDVLYDFINSGEPMRREYCDSNVRDREMAENFDRLSGEAFSAMQQAAKADPVIAARVRHLELRTVEEFFDLRDDPGCLKNLLGTGNAEQATVEGLRARLRKWMVQVNDPALAAFDERNNPAALEAFIESYRAQAQREVDALKPYEKAQGYRF